MVNPDWRKLDPEVRSLKGKLTRHQARFAALTLHPESETDEVEKWERAKGELRQEIETLEHDLATAKERMKSTPNYLAWNALAAEVKCQRLAPSRKRLLDTVKMIAYRAETAITHVVREQMTRADDGRALVRDLFRSEADILLDLDRGVLEIRIHGMSNPRSNRAIDHLLAHLNDSEMNYPGTNLRLHYSAAYQSNNVQQVSILIP